MTPVLILPLLLAPGAGVRVSVMGEGKLRFAVGRKVTTAAAATLTANATGFLADETGRAVTPAIRMTSGTLRIAMNGTVSVSGTKIGRLVLERPGTDGPEIGFPGEEGMGVLQVATGTTASSTTTGTAPKPAVSAMAAITIHASSDVEGDRILLRDVADISADAATTARLGAIDLGALPSIGIRRTLSPWTVKAALRAQGVKDSSITLNFPPDASVGRKGQTIDAKTIIAEATAKAREHLRAGDLSLVAGPAPMFVGAGDVTLDCDFDRKGSVVTMTVRASVDGKPAGSRVLKFAATGDGVKLGDTVRITVSRNGATVETDGKAKSSGFVGETIQVVTSDGTTFSATITASGTVTVNL